MKASNYKIFKIQVLFIDVIVLYLYNIILLLHYDLPRDGFSGLPQ